MKSRKILAILVLKLLMFVVLSQELRAAEITDEEINQIEKSIDKLESDLTASKKIIEEKNQIIKEKDDQIRVLLGRADLDRVDNDDVKALIKIKLGKQRRSYLVIDFIGAGVMASGAFITGIGVAQNNKTLTTTGAILAGIGLLEIGVGHAVIAIKYRF